MDRTGTGSGADSLGPGGVGAGNKANGVMGVRGVGSVSDISDVVGVGAGAGAGDTTNGGVGGNAVSLVPKINASRALLRAVPFLSAHVNALMISLNSRLYSFRNLLLVDRLASHTVAACSEESASAYFW